MNTIRTGAHIAGIGLAASLGLSLTPEPVTGEKESPERHNILFISIDDLRTELNSYSRDHIISPNIDRLASQGIRFERAYVQMAICHASRASMLTGYQPVANHIYSTFSVEQLMPGALTINKFFENQGYDVFGIGKLYHYPEDYIEQFDDGLRNQLSDWVGNIPQGSGYITPSQGRGYITPEAISQMDESGRGPAWEYADVEDNAYFDGYLTDRIVERLGQVRDSDRPFFIGVGFMKPHLPFNAPQKYWDLYDHDEITTADNPYYPINGSIYGKHAFGELRNYSNIPDDQSEPIDLDTQKMLIHGYYACVSYIDAQIGKIHKALEENGLLDNTIIVLWSDHGFKLGEHGMWAKHTNFEHDTRIPMIFSGPGIEKNAVTYSFAQSVDIFPTLADLTGFDVPDQLHGTSLVPVLQNPEAKVQDQAYSIWPSYRGNRRVQEEAILGYSVRTESFRYTKWVQVSSGEVLDQELFDHAKDPEENRNVIDDPQYAGSLPELVSLIRDYMVRYDTSDYILAE